MPENVQPNQPEFPMDDTSIFDDKGWDINFDPDTGRIVIDGEKSAKAPETPGIASEPEDRPVDPPSPPAPLQSDAGAERIAKLEGVVQQLIGIVTQMATVPNSNSLNQQGEPPQYDLNDQSQLSRYIGDSIQSALKPVMELLPRIVQRIEYQDTRAKYGADFDEAEPFIRELSELAAGGALTSEKAVALFKKIKGSNGQQSANTHGASQIQVPKQQGTAEALISKANRVQTQTGINGSVPSNQRPIGNVRDAFEAALEQLS